MTREVNPQVKLTDLMLSALPVGGYGCCSAVAKPALGNSVDAAASIVEETGALQLSGRGTTASLSPTLNPYPRIAVLSVTGWPATPVQDCPARGPPTIISPILT
mmetsp:Transcript_107408/g.175680  ORF Transcript_107408/g.175680 Transcript_107408/m.175680 type:complete len:104 (+) Transcript_107408:1142-1453(+)